MDSAELLEQLADIHLPPAVSYWPPAPGWWLLAILVISALVWAVLLISRRIKQRRICDFALKELDTIYRQFDEDCQQPEVNENSARLRFVNQLNSIFRRVALWHYPNSSIASLGGTEWVDFIRKKGDSSGMTDEIAEVISQGRFRPHCDVDVNSLYQFAQQWITSLYVKSARADISQ